jgi:hypothetical protein
MEAMPEFINHDRENPGEGEGFASSVSAFSRRLTFCGNIVEGAKICA